MTTTSTGSDQIQVRNPVTGATIGTAPDMTAVVPDLLARARAAQPGWAASSIQERARALGLIRRWMIEHRDAIVESTMAETGKTYEDALVSEVFVTADLIRFWERHAHRYLRDQRVPAGSPFVLGRQFTVVREPLGVVGVIAPWNYPLHLGLGDAIPALVAGNAVIVKPSEVTPLTTALVIEGVRDAGFPAEVLQVATGPGGTGAALVDLADMIQFTGSTRTGRAVGMRCAERLIPCSLELGGKDPMIVCADANIDRAVNAAVTWGLNNSGQVCMSVERIYVEEPVYEEFVGKLTRAVAKLRVGGGAGPGRADLGAITFDRQLGIIERHVADARAKGARIVTGGRATAPGQHFEPTVLVEVNHDMACMREETFGPLLPVMRVRDTEEAIALANDSEYGLTSSVYTRDLARGRAIARRLVTGTTSINDGYTHLAGRHAPSPARRNSGAGAPRNGREGILKFTHPHTIMTTRTGWLAREPGWIGMPRRFNRVVEGAMARLYRR